MNRDGDKDSDHSHFFYPPEAFAPLAALEGDHWWFRSRNRLILWVLRRFAEPFQDLLEVGVGTGFVLSAIHEAYPGAALSASDYHSAALDLARIRLPSVPMWQMDATHFDAADAWDVICAFDVIEHIPEDEEVLKNLQRALRSGGSLVLTVPQHRWL